MQANSESTPSSGQPHNRSEFNHEMSINRTRFEAEAGALAICGIGYLGVITSDEPKTVTYKDGTSAEAWTGVQIFPNPGAPWSSRNPICFDRIENLDGLPGIRSELVDTLKQTPEALHGDLYRAIITQPDMLKRVCESPALTHKNSLEPARYAEQELSLGDELVSAVYFGDETLTFRCGDKYRGDAYREGPCTLVTPNGVRIPAYITEATGEPIRIRDLTADQIRRNGFPLPAEVSEHMLASAHEEIAANMTHWYPELQSGIDSEIYVVGFSSPEQAPALKILRATFEQIVREHIPQAAEFRFEYLPPDDPETMLPRIGVEFNGPDFSEAARVTLLKTLHLTFDDDHCFESLGLDVEILDSDEGWDFGGQGSGFFLAFGEPTELLKALLASKMDC
jgi:hypothetical protein